MPGLVWWGWGRALYHSEGLGGAAILNRESQQPLAVLASFPGPPGTSGLGLWLPLRSMLRPALHWSQPQLKQEFPSCLVSYLQGFLLNHPQSPGLGQLPDLAGLPKTASLPSNVDSSSCQACTQGRLTPHTGPGRTRIGSRFLNTAWCPGACFTWPACR